MAPMLSILCAAEVHRALGTWDGEICTLYFMNAAHFLYNLAMQAARDACKRQ